MGFSEVLYNPVAQNLEGYHGDKREDVAEIIVPRIAIGAASNDIGFKRQEDGTYAAIVSDYDKHAHNAAWMTRLKVAYADRGIMQRAAKQGLRFIGKKSVNGKLRLQFMAK